MSILLNVLISSPFMLFAQFVPSTVSSADLVAAMGSKAKGGPENKETPELKNNNQANCLLT